jgi:heme/copper-type cytochrome/quinol oxidase subunit 2
MHKNHDKEYAEQPRLSIYWWVRQFVLIVIAGFYLVFGIQLLVSAYRLNDPTSFIYTFYASNFIILFSGALMVGFVIRLVTVYRRSRNSQTQSIP